MLSFLRCPPSCVKSCLFFFLMIRRPPRSTLFPTRRSSDRQRADPHVEALFPPVRRPKRGSRVSPARSEEHTSELQSRRELVCRLLLEKKKKKTKKISQSNKQKKNTT